MPRGNGLWGEWILQTKLGKILAKLVVRGLVKRGSIRGVAHRVGKSCMLLLLRLSNWILGFRRSITERIHCEGIGRNWLARSPCVVEAGLVALMWSWWLLLLEPVTSIPSGTSRIVVRMVIS